LVWLEESFATGSGGSRGGAGPPPYLRVWMDGNGKRKVLENTQL